MSYVKDEILKISGQNSTELGLKQLGIVDVEADFTIQSNEKWERIHSDYYALIFRVEYSDVVTSYIFKACVEFDATAGSISELLDRWVSRRRIVSSLGINTNRLIAFGEGVTLETFHTETIFDHFKMPCGDDVIRSEVQKLAWIHQILLEAHFLESDPMSLIRFDSGMPLVCDFSSSLGPKYQARDDSVISKSIKKVCAALSKIIDDKYVNEYRRIAMGGTAQ